ncbi:hypothetical protein NMY22_g7168 [Coprinellus aureogranulatus]|nr:hypothetical protein NMY22_g7168 [Coprinellus aureogranulatus]
MEQTIIETSGESKLPNVRGARIAGAHPHTMHRKEIRWEKPETIGDILSATVKDKRDKSKDKEGRARLKALVIAESAWLIWTLRCKWIMEGEGKPDKTINPLEAGNRWSSMINSKLNFDILASNVKYYKDRAIDCTLVKETWTDVVNDNKRLRKSLKYHRNSGGLYTLGWRGDRVNRFAERAAPWSLTISAGYLPHLGGNTLPLSSLIQYHSSLYSVIRLSIIGPRLAVRLGDLFLSSVASMLVQPTQQQPTHCFVDCFPHLPNLKRAVLVGVMSDLYFPHNLPWAKLTHLFLGNELNTQEVQAILRICTSLHEACFLLLPHRRDAPWGHGNLGVGTSTLQHLTDLTIMRSNGGNTPMHLRFDHLSFPSLSSMKVFLGLDISLAAVQLNSCAHLTHLTLVGCQFQVEPGYHIGAILDACPLLEELVAPVQGYKEELYQQLTYDPGQPRGRHLRVLILLCAGISDIHLRMNDPYQISMQLMLQYAPFDGVSSYSEPLSHCFPISRLAQLVRSRRTAGFDMDARLEYPTQLRRFIFRFLENESGVKQLSIFFTQLRDELITSLQPFTATGLESSVEIVGKQGNGLEYCPLTEGSPLRHWDQGAMDFLDSSSDWVYSTAMPPQDALMDTS